jgi:hypothetical protein
MRRIASPNHVAFISLSLPLQKPRYVVRPYYHTHEKRRNIPEVCVRILPTKEMKQATMHQRAHAELDAEHADRE